MYDASWVTFHIYIYIYIYVNAKRLLLLLFYYYYYLYNMLFLACMDVTHDPPYPTSLAYYGTLANIVYIYISRNMGDGGLLGRLKSLMINL